MTSETGSITTLKCRICGAVKTTSEFYFRKDSSNYRSECKECVKAREMYNKFKFSATDYWRLCAKQMGRCAICGSLLDSSRYTKLCIDHDHKTGKTRGLLCIACNTSIGLMKESPERLQNAIAYLNKHSDEDIV